MRRSVTIALSYFFLALGTIGLLSIAYHAFFRDSQLDPLSLVVGTSMFLGFLVVGLLARKARSLDTLDGEQRSIRFRLNAMIGLTCAGVGLLGLVDAGLSVVKEGASMQGSITVVFFVVTVFAGLLVYRKNHQRR